MTGYKKKNRQITGGDLDRANEFNLFYNRFDRTASVCPASAGFIYPHGCSLSIAAIHFPSGVHRAFNRESETALFIRVTMPSECDFYRGGHNPCPQDAISHLPQQRSVHATAFSYYYITIHSFTLQILYYHYCRCNSLQTWLHLPDLYSRRGEVRAQKTAPRKSSGIRWCVPEIAQGVCSSISCTSPEDFQPSGRESAAAVENMSCSSVRQGRR